MRTVLYLLATQALIGAFDTIYYHEWRARLPALGVKASEELRLHAFRDFIYALMFGTLPWIAWQGWWAAVLVVFLLAEIFLTLKDFVVEDHVRKVLGGVYPGERVTHAIMGIVYGASWRTCIRTCRFGGRSTADFAGRPPACRSLSPGC